MKPEDWQAYQAQRGEAPRTAGPSTLPPHLPPHPAAPPPRRGGRGGLGWPTALLLLGLAVIGGCCYSVGKMVDSVAGSMVSKASQPSVGVLVMENEIVGSIWVTETLNKFKEDPNIKSLVIRINSPGGAVAPCQEIYKAVKAFNKPVVVSMGSVAASGGLYVAAAGDVVMANPGTITGSIGVIMQSVEVSGTMDKLGLKAMTIKSGEFKDIGSPFREMRPDERALLQNMVSEVYEQFLADLTEGRKAKGAKAEDIRGLADGRIYSGSEAVKLGLVDELGGFEDAVMRAAKMGKIRIDKRPELVIEDGRKPWWDTMMRSQASPGLTIEVPPALTPGFSLKYLYQPDLSSGSGGSR